MIYFQIVLILLYSLFYYFTNYWLSCEKETINNNKIQTTICIDRKEEEFKEKMSISYKQEYYDKDTIGERRDIKVIEVELSVIFK